MAGQRKNFEYEPPIANEELSIRMGSSASRKLEARLHKMGWVAEDQPPPGAELESDEA